MFTIFPFILVLRITAHEEPVTAELVSPIHATTLAVLADIESAIINTEPQGIIIAEFVDWDDADIGSSQPFRHTYIASLPPGSVVLVLSILAITSMVFIFLAP